MNDQGPPLQIEMNPPYPVTLAKLTLVSLAGYGNTEIRDQRSQNAMEKNEQTSSYQSVTLYESSVNTVRIQLTCDDGNCHPTYHINVWIDLNDDEEFDDFENRVHQQSFTLSQEQESTYDLELCLPKVDGIKTKIGQHRMSLSLTPTVAGRKSFDILNANDTRQYTVNILPKPTCTGKTDRIIERVPTRPMYYLHPLP